MTPSEVLDLSLVQFNAWHAMAFRYLEANVTGDLKALFKNQDGDGGKPNSNEAFARALARVKKKTGNDSASFEQVVEELGRG